MNGIRIAKPDSDLSDHNPSKMQLDTNLETLPIALFGNWSLTIFTGYQVGVDLIQYEITHGLGYVPLFRGWEEALINGETVYRSIPTDIDANGFITTISATDQVIYVRAEFAASQYVGATYKKKGFVYVYEKEFKGLPR